MIDASVIVDALGGHGPKARQRRQILARGEMIAPGHIDLEAISAWRRQVRRGELQLVLAEEALSALRDLPVRRVPHEPLLDRIWSLRENLTTADAAYVALAERFAVPLVTSDAKLAKAPGPRCEFELIE